MMSCDRCTLLFNTLERVTRQDSRGRTVLDTRVCKRCAFEVGFLSVSSRVEELEEPDEMIQEVEPAEATELN
jgi:hypothetical protein